MNKRPHIVVIDPALRIPETESFNRLSLLSKLPLTGHLPVLFGAQTLDLEGDDVAGIIVFGSLASANDAAPWQKTLCEWLLPRVRRGIPTLGICFGHQFFAKAFGGEVDYVFPDRRKHLGFREIAIDASVPWLKTPTRGPLVVSHQEQVTRCPAEFRVIARSAECEIDGMAHRTLPLWTFQAHPEAGPEFLEARGQKLPPADSRFDFGNALMDGFLTWVATRV